MVFSVWEDASSVAEGVRPANLLKWHASSLVLVLIPSAAYTVKSPLTRFSRYARFSRLTLSHVH